MCRKPFGLRHIFCWGGKGGGISCLPARPRPISGTVRNSARSRRAGACPRRDLLAGVVFRCRGGGLPGLPWWDSLTCPSLRGPILSARTERIGPRGDGQDNEYHQGNPGGSPPRQGKTTPAKRSRNGQDRSLRRIESAFRGRRRVQRGLTPEGGRRGWTSSDTGTAARPERTKPRPLRRRPRRRPARSPARTRPAYRPRPASRPR
jgi:hypothetical protein